MKYLWYLKRGSEKRQGNAHHTGKHSLVRLTNALVFKIGHGIRFCRFWSNKGFGVSWFVTARDVRFDLSETSGEQEGV